MTYFEFNNLFYNFQGGFQPNRGTTDTSFNLLERATKAYDDQQYTLITYFD